jgi:hypothetical protein
MGLRQSLKRRALKLTEEALGRLMADERRAMRVAQVVGGVQRGKRRLDRSQERLLHALNFASKGDFKALGKKLSVLKRRARELDERVDGLSVHHGKGH